MNTVIGFDIGHSTIKIEAVSAGKKRVSLLIPSHACPAVPSDVDDTAEKVRKETVSVDGQDWFFGHTALKHGRNLPTGLSDDWIKTPEHTALFLGGLKALRDAGLPEVDDALIVLGLPGRTFPTQRHMLATLLSQYAGGAKVQIVPQPAGPYYQAMFTEEGLENPQRNIEAESWAIVEVGHFTTDTALFRSGEFIGWGLGSCNGVRVAAQELQRIVSATHGIQMDLVRATEALQTKRIPKFGNAISIEGEVADASRIITDQVIRHADQLLGDEASWLTGVILAGGGAPLVYPALKEHWPSTIMPHNPRFSVADGYCRFGQGVMRLRQHAEQKEQKSRKAA